MPLKVSNHASLETSDRTQRTGLVTFGGFIKIERAQISPQLVGLTIDHVFASSGPKTELEDAIPDSDSTSESSSSDEDDFENRDHFMQTERITLSTSSVLSTHSDNSTTNLKREALRTSSPQVLTTQENDHADSIIESVLGLEQAKS